MLGKSLTVLGSVASESCAFSSAPVPGVLVPKELIHLSQRPQKQKETPGASWREHDCTKGGLS